MKTTVVNDDIYILLKLYKLMVLQTFSREFIFVLLIIKNVR